MRYPVVVADPPWQFRDRGSRVAPDFAGRTRAARLYRTQPLAERVAIGPLVRDYVAAADAFLFLWAPDAMLLEGDATAVCRAWGFEPKQIVPWVKTCKDGATPRLGFGHYTRQVTESLIVARRGRARVRRRNIPGIVLPDCACGCSSGQLRLPALFAPVTRHSTKPDASYALVEALCEGPYLELYARRRYSSAWTCWGDEMPSPTARPSRSLPPSP